MKQLLLRVDDQLHARLVVEAKSTGRSVNSLANEVLAKAVDGESASRRERLNKRLRELGVADMNWGDLPSTTHTREDALAEFTGIGMTADEAIAHEREPR